MGEDTGARTSLSTTRRNLVRGAAWATPVVATVAGTPALAASPCSSCPDISFGTGTPTGSSTGVTAGNGRTTTTNARGVTWTFTTSLTGWNTANSYGFIAPVTTGTFANKGVYFDSGADPTTGPRTVTITSTSVTRSSGCLTIGIGIVDYTSTDPDPTVAVSYGGITCVGTYTPVGAANALVDRGIQTWAIPVTAPLSGVVRITLTYALGRSYDDVDFYQPRITCP